LAADFVFCKRREYERLTFEQVRDLVERLYLSAYLRKTFEVNRDLTRPCLRPSSMLWCTATASAGLRQGLVSSPRVFDAP